MMWDKIFIPTKNIESHDRCFILLPAGAYKHCKVEVPKKLVRETRKKTVRSVSYNETFHFPLYSKDGDYLFSLSYEDFGKAINALQMEGRKKLYGQR